jgi:hypothetical protein
LRAVKNIAGRRINRQKKLWSYTLEKWNYPRNRRALMHYVKNIRIPVLTSITTRIQKDPYWEQQRLKLRNLRKDRVELQKDLASYSYPKEITEMFLAMMIGGPAGILSGLAFIYVYYKAFVRIPWIRYIKKRNETKYSGM